MNEKLLDLSTLEETKERIRQLIKEKNSPVLVALDGKSGTGKSTIAKQLAEILGGVEINSDNFWSGGPNEEWDKKTPEQKSDKAIDWQRLRSELLIPLLSGKVAKWHSFDWEKGQGLSPTEIINNPSQLIILDGAYSSRPELQDLIDLSILVEVSDDHNRRQRLIARENEGYMKDWHSRWDVAENYYFSKVRPRNSFDLIINND